MHVRMDLSALEMCINLPAARLMSAVATRGARQCDRYDAGS